MDSDTGADRQGTKEEKKKWTRPPSSYGSMKSDSDEMDEEEEEEEQGELSEEEECEAEVAEACSSSHPVALPAHPSQEGTGLKMIRSESPETLYTMTTQQTKPPGAVVIHTRTSDVERDSEPDYDEDDMEYLACHSPVSEPVEMYDPNQTGDNNESGRLHPEQDLPHIFRSLQGTVAGLTKEELFKFKMSFYQWEPSVKLPQVMEGDILDFVDRIIEILGLDRSLVHTISTLENINKKEEAENLRNNCSRALFRFHLKDYLIRKHQVIREGVVRAGKQNLLETVYVEPEISTCGYGGLDPSHELRPRPLFAVQVPNSDTFVKLNNLFRQQREDGSPVRMVVTTGIPGIGMSVSVAKFSLDWAELRTNKDLQFVIKLSFRTFWLLRSKNPPQMISVTELIKFHHPECKDINILKREDCQFLIIMDAFDCYQTSLDWENAPVVSDIDAQAHPDTLIVNIIRGTVLPGARIWVLGRRAAVSQIPAKFIDVVTEIQGFSDEMKDDYLKKRFSNAELSGKIVAHYKRSPTLSMLARQPFVCWMVATVFERCFRFQGYGEHPPRLTPFYISILIVQTNRRLQFYYGKGENEMKWSDEDRKLLKKMGKMALKMLEKNTSVFYEEDVRELGLKLNEVTVFSGLCTELLSAASNGRRTFCFIHLTFQEFMAALYVFTMFRTESKNVLESGTSHKPKSLSQKSQSKSVADLIQDALKRTLNSPFGHYDMFLRFLCGLLSRDCYYDQLSRFLYHHNAPKLEGLDKVQDLLEEAIQTEEQNTKEEHKMRVENLKECLREMTQEDE